jgi:hypothetical protein
LNLCLFYDKWRLSEYLNTLDILSSDLDLMRLFKFNFRNAYVIRKMDNEGTCRCAGKHFHFPIGRQACSYQRRVISLLIIDDILSFLPFDIGPWVYIIHQVNIESFWFRAPSVFELWFQPRNNILDLRIT